MKPKLRFKEFTDDWEEKKLGEIGTFSKGKNLSKKDIDENGIKPCILYGELYTKYSEVINKVFSNTNVTENIIIGRKNDILIPSSGESPKEIAIASVLNIDNVALGGDINIYKTDMNGFFISYFLRKNTKKLSSVAQGATVVHLYSNSLKNIKIQLPSLPEQEKIGTFLSLVDQRIEKAEKKVSLLGKFTEGREKRLDAKIIPTRNSLQR